MSASACCAAFIGLGSNLDDPPRQLERALESLEREGASLCRTSSLYRTEPRGDAGPDDPWFFNRVAGVHSETTAFELLRLCQSIENAHGRARPPGARHAPRTLDLDLLLYGDDVIERAELSLPHPGLSRRRFVLVPMNEIAPDVRDPRSGLTMRELLERCTDPGVVERVTESAREVRMRTR